MSTCAVERDRKRMEDSLVDSEGLVSLSMLEAGEQAFGDQQENDDEEKPDKDVGGGVGEGEEDDNKKEEPSYGGGLIDHLTLGSIGSIPELSPRETEEDQPVTDFIPVSNPDEPALAAEEVSLLISIIED